jgi:hypothetical protein
MKLPNNLPHNAKSNIMRLKKCGVYVAFIRELKNRSGKVFQHRLIELLSYDRNLIDFAFIWDRTKDGWEFWSKKNKEINDMTFYGFETTIK